MQCVCAYVSYQATVIGVLNRVDDTELVQHLTHDDDTHPDCRQTGSHGPEATVGHRQRPQNHQDQVHHRWLQTEPHCRSKCRRALKKYTSGISDVQVIQEGRKDRKKEQTKEGRKEGK